MRIFPGMECPENCLLSVMSEAVKGSDALLVVLVVCINNKYNNNNNNNIIILLSLYIYY